MPKYTVVYACVAWKSLSSRQSPVLTFWIWPFSVHCHRKLSSLNLHSSIRTVLGGIALTHRLALPWNIIKPFKTLPENLKCLKLMTLISHFPINLFINSDAWIVIHCGLSRVKSTIYKPLSLKEYTIQEKYWDKRFLRYNGGYVNQFSKHFMLLVCTYGVMNF